MAAACVEWAAAPATYAEFLHRLQDLTRAISRYMHARLRMANFP
ncbi:hypothetical protein [Hydrogenibacillus sp. N12]|nr:hypothetical protein [Hydrogenibacillus sp. N12]